MEKVKTAFEKAMEKLEKIGTLTDEEKTEIRDRDRVREVMALFYRGEIRRDDVQAKLKGTSMKVLREAQSGLVDSLRLSQPEEEFLLRRDGLLAIEGLVDKPKTASIENSLQAISKLQHEYQDARERAIAEVRNAVERNPQLRMRQVRSADGRIVQAPVSVDEAVREQLVEFLPEHERRYEGMLAAGIERIRKEIGV